MNRHTAPKTIVNKRIARFKETMKENLEKTDQSDVKNVHVSFVCFADKYFFKSKTNVHGKELNES